jgi:exoribonuclease R
MSDPSALIPLAPTAVALVTLLISRLDRHRDAAKKELNIPDALRTLANLMRAWTVQASMTNLATREWVREEMPDRKPTGRQPRSLQGLRKYTHTQMALAIDTLTRLSDSQEHNNLLRVLELYTPELTDQLVKAVKQRDAQLTEIERELRMRQARDDQAVESYLDELDAAANRLEEASRQLDAYVRANVPIADSN